MGIFYHVHAVSFAEDLPEVSHEAEENIEKFYAEIDRGYTQVRHVHHLCRNDLMQNINFPLFRMPTIVGLQHAYIW